MGAVRRLTWITALLCAGLPAAAQAGELSYSTHRCAGSGCPGERWTAFRYQADPGETNRFIARVDEAAGTITFQDPGNVVTQMTLPPVPDFLDLARCSIVRAAERKNQVICHVSFAYPVRLVVLLEDGDDSYEVQQPGSEISSVHADGGAGDDRLDGRRAATRFVGGPGADLLLGGPGSSTSYSDRPGPVSVTYDGLANDGEPGEADDLRDIGYVTLTPAADFFSGSDAGEGAAGLGGGDVLLGHGGDDVLSGNLVGTAPVQVDGGAGDDWVSGGHGDDLLLGGPGNDKLEPFDGLDEVDAGPGDDRINLFLADGLADHLACGDGLGDLVHYFLEDDPSDVIDPDCETVQRP